jgi:hypothetical protein
MNGKKQTFGAYEGYRYVNFLEILFVKRGRMSDHRNVNKACARENATLCAS